MLFYKTYFIRLKLPKSVQMENSIILNIKYIKPNILNQISWSNTVPLSTISIRNSKGLKEIGYSVEVLKCNHSLQTTY